MEVFEYNDDRLSGYICFGGPEAISLCALLKQLKLRNSFMQNNKKAFQSRENLQDIFSLKKDDKFIGVLKSYLSVCDSLLRKFPFGPMLPLNFVVLLFRVEDLNTCLTAL